MIRKKQFILFITIVAGLYFLANYYIFTQGQLLFAGNPLGWWIYIVVFWVCALSYPAGRLLERVWLSIVSDAMIIAGSFWMAVMLYFFLGVLINAMITLVTGAFVPQAALFYLFPVSRFIFIITAALTLMMIVYGSINARSPVIRSLDLVVKKKLNEGTTLHFVVASDIHLGRIIGRRMARRIIHRINSLKPDVILLAGDVVDEDLAPVIRLNIGECLDHLKARWGVFSITGNHEYIGGAEKACAYLAEHGIRVLRDEYVRLDNGLYLVGREDRDKLRFTGLKRKPLGEIMKGIDKSFPVILLDHQPFELHQAEENGADLSISGHTHHGQIWPLNYFTRAMYELSWGYKKRGATNYYVSCGAGTWGPPIRIGNRPEIIDFRLTISDI